MVGKIRAQPLPGEEAENDTRLASRLSVYPKIEPPAMEQPAVRPRIADRPAFLQQRIEGIAQNPTMQNTNSKGAGMWHSFRHGVREALARGQDPLSALAGGIGWTGAAAFDKTTDEQLGERQAAGRMQGELMGLRQQQEGALKRRAMEANVLGQEIDNALKLQPKPKDPKVVQGKNGKYYRFSEDGTEAFEVKGIPGEESVVKAPDMKQFSGVWHEWKGGQWTPTAFKEEDEIPIPYKLDDGRTVKLKPGTAVTAEATRGERLQRRKERDEDIGRGEGKEARASQLAALKSQIEQEDHRYSQAQAAKRELDEVVQNIEKAEIGAATGKADERDEWLKEMEFWTKKAQALSDRNRQEFSDLFDDDPQRKFAAVLKLKPTEARRRYETLLTAPSPTLRTQQAPARRQGRKYVKPRVSRSELESLFND
jgi:hypothetical protein